MMIKVSLNILRFCLPQSLSAEGFVETAAAAWCRGPGACRMERRNVEPSLIGGASASICDGLKDGTVTLTTYNFIGAGLVARTTLEEPQARWTSYDTTSGIDYAAALDDFGRTKAHVWQRLGGAAYTHVTLEYDRNSNILAQSDELTVRQATGGGWTAGDHLMDSVYTNDALNRLSKADEGKMTGSAGSRSIASAKHTRIEEWTLSQTGNWNNQQLDLNGDGDQADSGERDWNGTFNKANECTVRGGNSPAYDAPGNMTDDGVNYTYVYDAFGRLKTVKTRGGSPTTVSEYTYNGLGHRIGWHYDADADSDVDGNDPWYWFFYDERWRMVATYRGSDSNPKERFVYHNAGASGYGGSSYIDSVICRESDDTVDWQTAAPDSTLQTRYYYLQNWRADVVALIQADGVPLEYVRYSAYGVPFVYSAADVNRDGELNILDTYSWDDYTGLGIGDLAVSPDVNRDGATNSADATFISDWDGTGLWSGSGRGFVSRLDSRKGYAGYEFDPATTQWHVRHRVLVSEMGRWSRRDPLGYVDGVGLYQYSASNVINGIDPDGTMHCMASALSQTLMNMLLPCKQIAFCAMLNARSPREGACCVGMLGFDLASLHARVVACSAMGATAGGIASEVVRVFRPVDVIPLPIDMPIIDAIPTPRDQQRYEPASCTEAGPARGRPGQCVYDCLCPPGCFHSLGGFPGTSQWQHVGPCGGVSISPCFCP